jgi:carboxylate-amine ligase
MAITDFSIGVEEEYQLVDLRTGALRSRARQVLESDWGAELEPEIHETMLEVGTRVCGSADQLDAELRRLRLHVGTVVAAQDLGFVAAGLHPFSRWRGQTMTRSQRYERIARRFGRVLRTEHVFGMHVHVAIPEGVDRLRLLNRLRQFLPHLLALSASSPFYRGEDTGYASYRTILTGRLPLSGMPPRLVSDAEYRRVIEMLLHAEALEDTASLYWNLRPHPRYPTLEFRVTDVCPRVADAVAIATLIRALVVASVEGLVDEFDAGLSPTAEDALLAANQWQAARYGLSASLVAPDLPDGRETARAAVARLVERIAPVADTLGDSAALAGVATILDRGNAAERMRREFPERGPLTEVVSWLATESQAGVGMDRAADGATRS